MVQAGYAHTLHSLKTVFGFVDSLSGSIYMSILHDVSETLSVVDFCIIHALPSITFHLGSSLTAGWECNCNGILESPASFRFFDVWSKRLCSAFLRLLSHWRCH